MADASMPGRGLVTRRAVGDVVRRAALASYGVVSVSGPRPWHSALAWIGRGTPGVRVRLGPPLKVDLYLAVARGVPVAEVAHNVESAVRYGVRRALDREIDGLAIHVDRLRTPVSRPSAAPERANEPTSGAAGASLDAEPDGVDEAGEPADPGAGPEPA
jgi:uncharacterized alkaline shock family protein YloU